MGKRITQQARGKGSLTFRVRPRAYRFRITYPGIGVSGKGKIVKLINSAAHSLPLSKIKVNGEEFIIPSADGIYEGQEVEINGKPEKGNILRLRDIPQGTRIFNIESYPGSGGKYLRSAGSFGVVMNKDEKSVQILIRRRRLSLHPDCRGVIGVAAGDGRKMKPMLKAGNKHHLMKSKGRKWHRTSAVKVNAVDHPFGSGRGKRIKSKISKRNSSPGQKVGHISPRKTGKRK